MGFRRSFKSLASRFLEDILRKVLPSVLRDYREPTSSAEDSERLRLLVGQTACKLGRQSEHLSNLGDVEFRAFSQFGEDGILDWLVHWIQPESNAFVEFGVETYREANTRFLVMNRNWRGLVMDGSEANMVALRSEEFYWRHDVVAQHAFVTAENVNDLLSQHGLTGPIGILSIDVDGNDYWILKAIKDLRAAILVVEVNPILGDVYPLTVPYKADFGRFDLHSSGLAFGASICAVRGLAERRGYAFVGTCTNGINAFFVREDLFSRIEPRITEKKAWPGLHRDARDAAGRLCYLRGLQRWEALADVQLWHCAEETMVRLGDLQTPYGERWLQLMG